MTKDIHSEICYANKYDIPFDIPEAETSNILISGANRTGKSKLSAGICSILQTFNWKIVAFDNTGIWRQISDIPTFYMVREERNYDEETETWVYPFPKSSMLYDTSLLVPDLQKSFVDKVTRDLWDYQIIRKEKEWCLICLEESQLFMRNIRGSVAQNLLRICSAGRNWKIRTLAITVDLALMDSAFIRLCQQRYHGRLAIEGNAKRRFRDYYGLDWTRIATELDLGFFVYLLRDKLKIVSIPEFKTQKLPQPYYVPMPTPQPQKTLWQKFKEWIT